jgi:hypothetical protein
MELVNLSDLTTQLLTISAMTKVVVDLIKLKLPKEEYAKNVKYVLSMLFPILMTFWANISLFETGNESFQFAGIVAAGLVAGLGSNVIHEVMKVLQTMKTLKK